MANDYIRRQDAVSALADYIMNVDKVYSTGKLTQDDCIDCAESVLDDLSSADVAPVRHGRWLPIVSYNHTYKCSECGRLLVDVTDGLKTVAKHYPYCHCGARMDKE